MSLEKQIKSDVEVLEKWEVRFKGLGVNLE